MLPEWMLGLQLSDYLMLIFMVGVLWFVIDYGGFTGWWRHPVGWILLGFPISVALLLALIIYGVIFGHRVEEWLRVPVMALLIVMMVGKIIAVHVSRREGALERREHAASRREHDAAFLTPEQGDPVTEKTATELAVPDIWYKGKRVLRTAFTTLLTVLPLIPQIIAIIQGQWQAPWLGAIAVQAVAINAALTAIISLPTVNAWLINIGLGSVPKSSLIEAKTIENGKVQVITTVAPDPKAITPDAPVIVDGREAHPNVG
jgi:hypothetical protein